MTIYNKVDIDPSTQIETVTSIKPEMEEKMEDDGTGNMKPVMKEKIFSSKTQLEADEYSAKGMGGARRRRKTMKKMSKRKLKKWCKSKKNCRTKMGRKMCKK